MTDELKEWYLMPSIKECLVEYEKQELGLISDIAKHGCSGGVTGIIYYDETSAFHDQHEEEIWQLVGDQAPRLVGRRGPGPGAAGRETCSWSCHMTFVVVWLCLLFMFPSLTLAGTGILMLSLVGVL
jgi:hypothetical protein